MRNDITILIPTLATPFTSRALGLCLQSLNETAPDIPIIVGVNGEYAQNHEEENSHIRFVSFEKQGQCHAVNRMAELVSTEWMLISNDDMVYPPGWLQKLLEGVQRADLLVASPNLVEPRAGAPPFIVHFCGGIGTEGTEPDFKKQQFLDFAASYHEPFQPHNNVGLEKGFNLPYLIRKDVWDTIGGYDEAYDPWGSCSDTDLQTRLLLAGVHPHRVRNSLVYHFSNTSGTFTGDRESFRHENWRHYERKFGFKSFGNADGVWYEPTIPLDRLIFTPEWMGKYGKVNG